MNTETAKTELPTPTGRWSEPRPLLAGIRVYLSGKITGRDPDETAKQFEHYANMFREKYGAEVLNPLENGLPRESRWTDHMRADVKLMMDADLVAMLPGWRSSKGANIERELARALSIEIVDLSR